MSDKETKPKPAPKAKKAPTKDAKPAAKKQEKPAAKPAAKKDSAKKQSKPKSDKKPSQDKKQKKPSGQKKQWKKGGKKSIKKGGKKWWVQKGAKKGGKKGGKKFFKKGVKKVTKKGKKVRYTRKRDVDRVKLPNRHAKKKGAKKATKKVAKKGTKKGGKKGVKRTNVQRCFGRRGFLQTKRRNRQRRGDHWVDVRCRHWSLLWDKIKDNFKGLLKVTPMHLKTHAYGKFATREDAKAASKQHVCRVDGIPVVKFYRFGRKNIPKLPKWFTKKNAPKEEPKKEEPKKESKDAKKDAKKEAKPSAKKDSKDAKKEAKPAAKQDSKDAKPDDKKDSKGAKKGQRPRKEKKRNQRNEKPFEGLAFGAIYTRTYQKLLMKHLAALGVKRVTLKTRGIRLFLQNAEAVKKLREGKTITVLGKSLLVKKARKLRPVRAANFAKKEKLKRKALHRKKREDAMLRRRLRKAAKAGLFRKEGQKKWLRWYNKKNYEKAVAKAKRLGKEPPKHPSWNKKPKGKRQYPKNKKRHAEGQAKRLKYAKKRLAFMKAAKAEGKKAVPPTPAAAAAAAAAEKKAPAATKPEAKAEEKKAPAVAKPEAKKEEKKAAKPQAKK